MTLITSAQETLLRHFSAHNTQTEYGSQCVRIYGLFMFIDATIIKKFIFYIPTSICQVGSSWL